MGAQKKFRQGQILKVIGSESISSQDDLRKRLHHLGMRVTQATLSRDLKRLGIGKAPSASGGYIYVLSDVEVRPGSDLTYVQDFMRGFLSLEFSGTFGLMRTLPGHASSVASALDNLHIREVLGTIAGDDTILIVPRNGVAPFRLTRALRARIPGFPGGE